MATDELNIWLDEVPVFDEAGDHEFLIWLDGTPLVEETGGAEPLVVPRRRIAFIF